MRELPHPETADIKLTEVMHALSDPVRLELFQELRDDSWHGCTALADAASVHKSTLSHHYRVLRESGLTETVQEGRLRHVRLRRDDLDARFPGLLDAVLASLDT